MRKLMLLPLLSLFLAQSASAITPAEQQEALKQLTAARMEIDSVRKLIPGFLKHQMGEPLESADKRIAYAEQVLGSVPSGASWYCTIESTFDGSFDGRGATELEAKNAAKRACQTGSRSNGFHCRENSLSCTKER